MYFPYWCNDISQEVEEWRVFWMAQVCFTQYIVSHRSIVRFTVFSVGSRLMLWLSTHGIGSSGVIHLYSGLNQKYLLDICIVSGNRYFYTVYTCTCNILWHALYLIFMYNITCAIERMMQMYIVWMYYNENIASSFHTLYIPYTMDLCLIKFDSVSFTASFWFSHFFVNYWGDNSRLLNCTGVNSDWIINIW